MFKIICKFNSSEGSPFEECSFSAKTWNEAFSFLSRAVPIYIRDVKQIIIKGD